MLTRVENCQLPRHEHTDCLDSMIHPKYLLSLLEFPPPSFTSSLAYSALGRHEEALDRYKKALQLDPANESYKNNMKIAEEKSRESGGTLRSTKNRSRIILGYSFVRLLVHSLACSLTGFASSLRCDHSFARSPTHFRARGKVKSCLCAICGFFVEK